VKNVGFDHLHIAPSHSLCSIMDGGQWYAQMHPSCTLAMEDLQESPAIADKPARRESLLKIAPIRCAYNVVADNIGLSS